MQRIINFLGLAALLTCFLLSAGHVFFRSSHGPEAGGIVVRVAHWQLEGGVREAFDAVARAYETLHPGVRVVQIPIPERIFPEWATTQLIGGTAPDLVEIGLNASGIDSSTDERLVRYYEPLGRVLNAPNPYDADAPDLAALPWRDTFVDGLRSVYNPRLLEFYSVPTTLTTVRVFYNQTLWRRLLGETPPPRTYEKFAEICHRAAAGGGPGGVPPVIPVAGSSYTA